MFTQLVLLTPEPKFSDFVVHVTPIAKRDFYAPQHAVLSAY